MQRTRRRMAAIMPALSGMALVAMAATSPFPNARAAAEQAAAREWVARNADHLPKTFEEIAGYPVTYRKAIVVRLTDSESEALWRTHLESFVRNRQDLSPMQLRVREALGVATLNEEQLSFLKETLESLHAGIGEGTTTETKKAYALEVCKRAKALFPKSVAFRITGVVGAADPMRKAVGKASLVGLTDAIRGATVKLGLRQAPVEDCGCNSDSTCSCPNDEECLGGCKPTTVGCGCFGVFGCDGGGCFVTQ